MGRMAEWAAEQQQFQDEQEALFQLSMERQQMAEEARDALARALNGMGLNRQLAILCREAGIDSPYK